MSLKHFSIKSFLKKLRACSFVFIVTEIDIAKIEGFRVAKDVFRIKVRIFLQIVITSFPLMDLICAVSVFWDGAL